MLACDRSLIDTRALPTPGWCRSLAVAEHWSPRKCSQYCPAAAPTGAFASASGAAAAAAAAHHATAAPGRPATRRRPGRPPDTRAAVRVAPAAARGRGAGGGVRT